jgi:glutamate racemase
MDNSNNNRPIGVFDSGIGGLTVLKALVEELPGEAFVYFGDTARVPYGTKSASVVKQFSLQNSLFLLKQEVKLIVVACNTASATALEFLKSRLSLPLVGVIEPGAKAAIKCGADRPIGIIGTRSTIESGAYQRELQRQNPQAKFIAQACPLFVPLVEEGLTEGIIAQKVVEHYLSGLKRVQIASLILGCTHYPLLKEIIADYLGSQVYIIDSASSTAEAVEFELRERDLLSSGTEGGGIKFFASDVSANFIEISRRFFGGELPAVEKVEFEVADFWV